jgi:hemerythrin
MAKMNYVSWRQEYSVGVDEIDYQHKDLLNLVNYAMNHCTGNKEEERKFFDGIIENVIKHLKDHFSTEEKIMEKTNYPKYNEHKDEHDKTIDFLIKNTEEIKQGKIELNLFEITEYVKNWILGHVPEHDKEASVYFKKGYENK